MKSLLCWSQWQHSHFFGSSHNFMLYILLRLYCNQSFFVAPVSSRLFPDFGTPKMTIKSNRIRAIQLGRQRGERVSLEDLEKEKWYRCENSAWSEQWKWGAEDEQGCKAAGLEGKCSGTWEAKGTKEWEREEGVLPTPRTANAPLNKGKLDKTCDGEPQFVPGEAMGS